MNAVLELWLPILVATIAVFITSAIIWMATPLHKADIKALPDEDAFCAHLTALNPPPGTYMFPHFESCKNQDGSIDKDKMHERYSSPPWGVLTVWPKSPSFAHNLGRTLLVFFIVVVFTAYLTAAAQPFGAPFGGVFRAAAIAATLGFAFGGLPNDIFFGKPTRFVLTDLLSAIIYALVTALVFALLWPGAVPVA